MSPPICLIDTSVFLNLLKVPGRHNELDVVNADFATYTDLGASFILPMASIIETGNHIAQNGNGDARRKTAERFVKAVQAAFDGNAPWISSEFPRNADIHAWLDQFPAHAGSNKSPAKTTEGTSFGDLSIIQEYRQCLRRFGMSEIFIWSLDADLIRFHHRP
jgi:hypothetical protein